jgi:hypothetical protein
VSQKAERDAKVELYINSTWTEHYMNTYVAQAIAFSENGNHATIYATGITADEANAKLMGALRELKLLPEGSMERA